LSRRRVFERGQCRARAADGKQARAARPEDSLRVDLRIEHEPDEAVTHLVPVLKPPPDFLRWIRIELVGPRVVEVRDADEARAFWQIDGCREDVPELPVEIPLRSEQRLRLAVGEDRAQLVIFAA